MLQVILNTLPFIQIALAVILIVLILIQKNDGDAGGAFGGGHEASWHVRRGGEKFVFIFTVLIAILFVASVILDIWKK